ncbi:MAG: hypothetical protein ABIH23_10110 [bacterium]
MYLGDHTIFPWPRPDNLFLPEGRFLEDYMEMINRATFSGPSTTSATDDEDKLDFVAYPIFLIEE